MASSHGKTCPSGRRTEQTRDKYLQKNYGITLEEYNVMLKKNNGGCWICGRPPKTRSLHVDHDHKIAAIKITAKKTAMCFPETYVWEASVHVGNCGRIFAHDAKRSVAVSRVRQALKRLSVRGILCYQCNKGLKFYRDNPQLFMSAACYLEEYRRKIGNGRILQESRASDSGFGLYGTGPALGE